MFAILLSALVSMVTRLVTSEFIEFAILKGAEALVKRTSTSYDDEFLAKIEELLDKSKK